MSNKEISDLSMTDIGKTDILFGKADLLLEIGTGELPPDQVESIANQLAKSLQDELAQMAVGGQEVEVFYTPRRVAVRIRNVALRQLDQRQLVRGPAVKVAFDQDGLPTLAATKFAQSCGVPVGELFTVTDAKGEFVAANRIVLGSDTIMLLPAVIKRAVKAITFKRGMYWGDGVGPFIRPVMWILALLGDQIIPVELFGVAAGNVSYGHRVHHPSTIVISQPDQYDAVLADYGHVLVSPSRRRQVIVEQLENVKGVIVDPQLLTEINNLVEWPVVMECWFDERFLNVPQEIIVTSLKHHQRCFAVQDDSGHLVNKFVVVANLISSDPGRVIAGNELVVKARLEDAEYFYQQDLKHSLPDYLGVLKNRTFFKDLGSLYDKSNRNAELADIIASLLSVNPEVCRTAALYAKCDLASQVVGEFPELQGTMGGCYALVAGYGPAIAQAISEHYFPRFAADGLPESIEGCVVSLADRIDSLVGMFSVGQQPSGDKDPLALRRMAMGIIRILIGRELSLDLREIILQSISSYSHLRNTTGYMQELIAQLLQFLAERLQSWYAEQKISSVLVKAVLSTSSFNPTNINGLVLAVADFMDNPAAEQLLSSYKRVHNLLQKQLTEPLVGVIDPELFDSEIEHKLLEVLKQLRQVIWKQMEEHRYHQVLDSLLELSVPLDEFLTEVKVVGEDEAVSRNRLMLLQELERFMLGIVDFGYLVSGNRS